MTFYFTLWVILSLFDFFLMFVLWDISENQSVRSGNFFPSPPPHTHKNKNTTNTNSSYEGKLVRSGKVPFKAKVLCYGCFQTLECVWGEICFHPFFAWASFINPEMLVGLKSGFSELRSDHLPLGKILGSASHWQDPHLTCHKLSPRCFHISIPYMHWESPNTNISLISKFLIYQNNNIAIPHSGVLSWCTGYFLHYPRYWSCDQDSCVRDIHGLYR